MKNSESKIFIFLEILLFGVFAWGAVKPVVNYDFWFHLKYGEYFVTNQKLLFTDIYSHTAFGSPTIPYEWLFQSLLYIVYNATGVWGVQGFVVTITLGYFWIFRQILKQIFEIGFLGRTGLLTVLYIISYDFFVERPQIAAYFFFILILYLLLARIFLGKKWLFLTPFIFWMWVNSHASMILGLYLFGAWIAAGFLFKNKNLAKDLGRWGFINALVTLFPPLGLGVYKLLFLFWEKRNLIASSISEWAPLYRQKYFLAAYLFLLLIAFVSFGLIIWKKKSAREKYRYLYPLIPLLLFAFSGVRHTPFTLPVLLLLLIPLINYYERGFSKEIRITFSIFLTILVLGAVFFYRPEVDNRAIVYPDSAINFIKDNLTGKMFNEYDWGGYLLNKLGPEQKTFIDGRTEMFLERVLPDYLAFSKLNLSSDQEYLSAFNNLADKYHVTWAILRNNRFSLSWRLARVLGEDKNWVLVYFDDSCRIYAKKIPLNNELINKWGMYFTTPWSGKMYRSGGREKAYEEYIRVFKVFPSAISANAIGVILMEEKKYEEAKKYFESALKIDKTSVSPRMNLAEILAYNGDLEGAIDLYQQAVKDDPTRGIAYLRLGQLLKQKGDSLGAKEVWERGLKSIYDTKYYNLIQKELLNNK